VFKLSLIICLTLSSIHIVVAGNVDPTRPFNHKASSNVSLNVKKLVLESIIHGKGIHTAVINGKMLKPGESIREYRLVAVNDDSVVLRSETERLKLFVFKGNVFKRMVVKK